MSDPVRSLDAETVLAFAGIGTAQAHNADAVAPSARAELDGRADALRIALPLPSPEDHNELPQVAVVMGHGRFAAPGNAVRRQVQVKPINPRTADELAGFLREVSYTLTDVRQGEAVPAIKVERVPADLGTKDGNERKQLFISAILPVVLETNHRVLVDREKLVALRDKMAANPDSVTALERVWLEDLAQRYEASADQLDELLRRVDIVPPSMAIAQGGVESGWGTSVAARTGNALYGQMQVTARNGAMPQPFSNVGEATEAYITNLNTHPAYAGFRTARAAARERGETLEGYRLVGTLLRYSERGMAYVQFVRQIMRENDLHDFDKARLLEASY
ncbi:MAG: glucosaminidase domain-containing protein [Proteobacteria bacterium]|nr:glucosaminidase domain-containing protein [Pseudomonadota bacterium]